MCGICGFIDFSISTPAAELRAIVERMSDTLSHRGPDDSGAWCDVETGVGLGHRRLAILDLSPAGHQPMVSRSGRYVIVFNGEIYNFEDLRARLEFLGHSFRGHSDTEIALGAFEAWGISRSLELFEGMFAFACWDRKDRRLQLARDRLGEKPLYYGWMDKTFFFASELRAIRLHPAFRGEIDRDVLSVYLRHDYIPAPHSIYQRVHKLCAGTLLDISIANPEPVTPTAYWSMREIAEHGAASPFAGSDEEAIEQLEFLLRGSVRRQMIADVPLGAFLSGGIDSPLIVALMQSLISQPVKTFTIGFHHPGLDETRRSREIANSLGTDHTGLYASPEDALGLIPHLPEVYDEPFADPSQIPTLLVSRLARNSVKVSLSGDGGDELFSGYNLYAIGRRLWNATGWLPESGRRALADLIESRVHRRLMRGAKFGNPLLVPSGQSRRITDRLGKLAQVMRSGCREQLYWRLASHDHAPETLLRDSSEPLTVLTDPSLWAVLPEFTSWMMFADASGYLPEDILVKLDRASMSVGLESRVPFLDRQVVEFAWRLPLRLKVRNGRGKWIVRQLLKKYLPQAKLGRRKHGFSVPLADWLRGPLRDWAEELLEERRLRIDGFFCPEAVRAKWQEHVSGVRNWESLLWNILMFQAWLTEVHQEPVIAEVSRAHAGV